MPTIPNLELLKTKKLIGGWSEDNDLIYWYRDENKDMEELITIDKKVLTIYITPKLLEMLDIAWNNGQTEIIIADEDFRFFYELNYDEEKCEYNEEVRIKINYEDKNI